MFHLIIRHKYSKEIIFRIPDPSQASKGTPTWRTNQDKTRLPNQKNNILSSGSIVEIVQL